MKRGMKAQSNLITTVLIILLVLAAVIIVWNVVIGVLNSSSSQAGIGQFNVGGQISYAIQPTNNTLNVQVDRNSGAGNISGVRIALELNNGQVIYYENKTFIPGELESKFYSLNGSSFNPVFNVSNITKVSFYFLMNENNKEIVTREIASVAGPSSGINQITPPIGAIACHNDSECQSDHLSGSLFCNISTGNVYQNYTNFTCNSPGTQSSSCTNGTVAWLNQTCTSGCSGGVCNPIPISSCTVISSPGSYILTSNIAPNSNLDSCINITSSNVNLNCNNNWISNRSLSKSTNAIYAGTNLLNITIKNCNLSMATLSSMALGYGIRFNLVNNSFIAYNIIEFSGSAIYLTKSSYNTINNNNIRNNSCAWKCSTTGIYLTESSYNNLTSNSINYTLSPLSMGSGYGISLSSSHYNGISNSNFCNNRFKDISFYNSNFTQFNSNKCNSSSIISTGSNPVPTCISSC